MAIRFRRVSRLCDPTNKEAGKKVYPVISYQYDTSATLDEFAKEIASASGVSEGETISVLKDFRTLLKIKPTQRMKKLPFLLSKTTMNYVISYGISCQRLTLFSKQQMEKKD